MDWIGRLSGLERLAAAVQLNPVPVSQRGTVTVPPGLYAGDAPEAHEVATMRRLAALRFDVSFNAPDHDTDGKNPDLTMDGHIWDMKSPTGAGAHNISHQFARARSQATRLVIDLARSPKDEVEAANEVVRRLALEDALVEVIVLFRDASAVRLTR